MKSKLISFVFMALILVSIPGFAQDNFGIEMIGRVFHQLGQSLDVAKHGDYVYLATSQSGLHVFDVSDPENPVLTDYYEDNRGSSADVVVDENGEYAYVADGLGGLMVFNVSDPDNIELTASLNTNGYPQGIDMSGDYVYLANGRNRGVAIVDVSNPEEPELVANLESEGYSADVKVSGDFLYFCDSSPAGLRIIDVSDPANPNQVSSIETPGYCNMISLQGNYAYIADGRDGGLRVIDIFNPRNPREVGTYDTPGYANGLTVAGDYAYIGDGGSGLRIVDISNPNDPFGLGAMDVPDRAYGVVVDENVAYVAGFRSGLIIGDVSDPENPEQVGMWGTPDWWLREAVIEGDVAYVANSGGGLKIVDISDPENPDSLANYSTDSPVYGVFISGNRAYLALTYDGLAILDIQDPSTPELLGSYDTQYAMDVYVAGNTAYIADGRNGGLLMLNVADPNNIRALGNFETRPGAYGGNNVQVRGNIAYFTDGDDGFRTIDVSNPNNPRGLGVYGMAGEAISVDVNGDVAYVVEDYRGDHSGLHIFDVSNPVNMQELGFHSVEPKSAEDVKISGNYAYLGLGGDGWQILDVSDPENIEVVGFYNSPGYAYAPAAAGDLAYHPDGSSFIVYDCSEALSANSAPQWEIYPEETIEAEEGDTVEFIISAEDPDEDDLTLIMNSDNLPEAAEFTDNEDGTGHFMWITDFDSDGEYSPQFVVSDGELMDKITVNIRIMNVSAPNLEVVPDKFTLTNVYPNPFNHQISVEFSLPWNDRVDISIVDPLGATLNSARQWYGAGNHSISINAAELPAGAYILKMQSREQVKIAKISLIK